MIHLSNPKPLTRKIHGLQSPVGKRESPVKALALPNREILYTQVALVMVAALILVCILASPTFGVTVADLQEPIKDLKDTIFGGWMWVPKIGAAVGGCLLAVYNQSVMPLATGAGVGLGIHFYDLYIKADGALI